MKKNNKGFTLAELLIVVAIIAVLTAVAIPVFTAQLEKSREAVDAANIRDAYALIVADSLMPDEDIADHNTNEIEFTAGSTTDGVYSPATATVTARQTQAQWQSGAQDIAGTTLAVANGGPGSWSISVDGATGIPTIEYTAG